MESEASLQSPLRETEFGRNLGESHRPMPEDAMRGEEIIIRGLRFCIARQGRWGRGNVVVVEIIIGHHIGISRHDEIVVGVVPACRVIKGFRF